MNSFNSSKHSMVVNAERGDNLAQILHSTYAVILKSFFLGSDLRLYIEQFK